jgi:hypothetical protein
VDGEPDPLELWELEEFGEAELREDSQTELVALLSALETCLEVNDIRSVRLKLDDQNYTMAT